MNDCIFLQPWWLDAAAPGAWGAVTAGGESGRTGWLPFAKTRVMGLPACGLPELGRLIYPVVSVDADKRETIDRARFHLELELIAGLPRAHYHQFVLPPGAPGCLAWQAHGFVARVQHTYIADPGQDEAALWAAMRDKTRNILRRARETLRVADLDAAAFAAEYARAYGPSSPRDECARAGRLAAAALARGQGRALGAADREGRLLAAALFVWDERDCYFYLATRDPGRADNGALALLVWTAMCEAVGRGLRFDFDGVSSRNRLRFMQGFGGRLAQRTIVERGSLLYDGRLLLRRLRHSLRRQGVTERFY